MKSRVYSLYDKLARRFGPLMLFANDDVACRSVATFLRQKSNVADAPSSYAVYCLGEFEEEGVVSVSVLPLVAFVPELVSEVSSLTPEAYNG